MSTLDKIIRIIGEELGREKVTAENTLEDLGLDSLEFVFLMTAIAKEIAEIPESKWAGIHTVGDLVRALEAPEC